MKKKMFKALKIANLSYSVRTLTKEDLPNLPIKRRDVYVRKKHLYVKPVCMSNPASELTVTFLKLQL